MTIRSSTNFRWRWRGFRELTVTLLCVGALACGNAVPNSDEVTVDEAFHEVNGVRLFVKTMGAGEPIVVVHGGPGLDHTYLLPGMRGLADRHRLIFYDQRGSGRSAGPVDSTSITFENFLADIDRLRQELGLGKVNLLGHSFGGLIAIRYALMYPERVKSLMLMNTVEPGSRYREETAERQRERRTPEDSVTLADLAASEGFQDHDAATVNQMLWVSFRSMFADPSRAGELVIDLDDRTARYGGDIPRLLVGPLGDYDYWDELGEIRAPTLVLHGTEDVIPVEMARQLCGTIPRCAFVPVSDAGHFPYIEAPDSTFSAIDAFLTRQ